MVLEREELLSIRRWQVEVLFRRSGDRFVSSLGSGGEDSGVELANGVSVFFTRAGVGCSLG